MEKPYFNEPGFETNGSAAHSEIYNMAVRYQTMRVAMAGYLTQPSPLFQGTIRAHLLHKRDHIKKQIHVRGGAGHGRCVLAAARH